MRKISLKAFLISNFADLLMFAVGLIVWVAGSFAYLAVAGNGSLTALELEAQFNSANSIIALSASISFFASVAAGYLAARLAGRAELLHGALSSSFIVLLNLYGDIWGFPGAHGSVQVPLALELIISYSGPLFGMLGAYLSLRRLRPVIA